MALGDSSLQEMSTLSNLPIEAAVLGAVMFDETSATFERLIGIINPDDFSSPAHQHIWEAYIRLDAMGLTINGMTVTENIQSRGSWEFDEPLGPLLTDILNSSAFGPELFDFAKLVARTAARRRLYDAGKSIASMAEQPGHDEGVTTLIENARNEIQSVEDARKSGAGNWTPSKTSIGTALDELEEALKVGGPERSLGLTTGLRGLDTAIGGMHSGDLIVLAGRPSMGKTALAVNIGRAAAHSGGRVAFLSMEMDETQLGYRIASGEARMGGEGKVEYRRLRSGDVGQNEMAILRKGQERAPEKLYVEYSGKLTIDQIKARVRQLKRKLKGVDLVIIDYLQFMRIELPRGMNMASAVGEVTGELKALAKALGCPVIVLSQLSRALESRDNKRPMLSDLRDSGSIEQDADIVMFAYRDEYYLERTEPSAIGSDAWSNWKARHGDAKGKLEIILGKVRMGATCTVHTHFEASTDTVVDDKADIPERAML